jgi:hypothetical protein
MLLENKDLVSPTTCPPTHKSVHEYFWADDSRVDRRIPLPSAAESLKELEHIKKARTTLLNRVDASCKETRLLVTFDGTVGECVLEAAEAAAAQEAAAAEKAAKEARDHALQATWAVVATSAELAKCNAKAELAAARAAFACACVAVLEKDGLVLDGRFVESERDAFRPVRAPEILFRVARRHRMLLATFPYVVSPAICGLSLLSAMLGCARAVSVEPPRDALSCSLSDAVSQACLQAQT